MRVALGLAALVLVAACGDAPTGPTASVRVDLSRRWERASPAEVGMNALALLAAAGDASRIPRFRSLLVARHGRLVAEQYFGGTDSTTLFDVRSVTKSVVGALTGIALHDGVLPATAAPIALYLAREDTLDAVDSAVTVRHLLTTTSGYAWDETAGPDYNTWIVADNHVQYLLDRAHAASPGATFTYNSAAVHTLGGALQGAAATAVRRRASVRCPGRAHGRVGAARPRRRERRLGDRAARPGFIEVRSAVPATRLVGRRERGAGELGGLGHPAAVRLADDRRPVAASHLRHALVGIRRRPVRLFRLGLRRPVRVCRAEQGSRGSGHDRLGAAHRNYAHGARSPGAWRGRQRRGAGRALAPLDVEREPRIHQRQTAVHRDHLARDPARVRRAQERDGIPDVRRRAEPAHRRPSLVSLVPLPNHVLRHVGQGVEHAVLDPSGADGVHCDATLRECHGEVAAQRFHGALGRAHADPRLPAAGAPARRVGDRDDPPALPHEGARRPHCHQER